MTACVCGEELTITVSGNKQSSYCQSCGTESTSFIEVTKPLAPIISLSRAAILNKLSSKAQTPSKKPKQIRDRTDYTKAHRSR